MFESKAPQAVLDSIKALEADARSAYERECDELLDFHEGGAKLVKYLLRHTRETDKEWASRRERFQSYNYAGRMGRQIINGLYGKRVERSIEGINDTDSLHKTFDDIWLLNNYHSKMRGVSGLAVPAGSGFVRPWWYEPEQGEPRLRYAVLKPQDILAVPRGDDAEKLLMLVERRHEKTFDGDKLSDRCRYFIWTDEMHGELQVSGDGQAAWVPEKKWQPNIYKTIPHVVFRGESVAGQYLGNSLTADAITIQKALNNRASVDDVVILMQGFSQMIIEGDAPSDLELSEMGFIKVDKGGRVYYLQANAPIAEVEASIDKMIERMCDIASVPISAVRGGSANSGIQLAIEMKPLADVVEGLKTTSGESERELFEKSLAVLEAHGVKVGKDAVLTVDFPESFLPSDKQAQEQNDLAKVAANLMSRKQFLKKQNPDLTDEQADEMLAEIDGDVATGRQNRTAIRPGFPPSLLEEEAE